MKPSEVEQKLDELPDLKMEKLWKKRKESLGEFLIKFFTHFNNTRNTIYVEGGAVQTAPGRRRSLDDIYKICKYYYPDMTLKELIRELHVELPRNLKSYRSSPCAMMHKRAYYHRDGWGNNIYNRNSRDQWGITWNEWIDYAV